MSQGRQDPDAQELTITSSLGGCGNSAERAKQASTSNKRKAVVTEEPECQSEVSAFSFVILWMHASVTLFICGVRVLWNKMW
jgi:hypothetical protein